MLYYAKIKPGSKKGPLVIESETERGTELTVYLREKPIEGQANTALIKLLSDHFQVAKSCIAIKSGTHSHLKIIEIIK